MATIEEILPDLLQLLAQVEHPDDFAVIMSEVRTARAAHWRRQQEALLEDRRRDRADARERTRRAEMEAGTLGSRPRRR